MAKHKPKGKSFRDKDERETPAHSGQKRNTNRGRRPQNSKNPRTDTRDSENFARGYSNDPNWWMKAGQLSIDTSQYSTFTAVGAEGTPIMGPIPAEGDAQPFTSAVIARYDYVPYFGTITSPTDAINVAAKLLYDTINSKNSRNTAYDPSDLMVYIIAVANAWGLFSVVQRICGMYNTFSVVNRYWWVPLANSMRISPLATQNDITKWRNLANLMAIKLNMLSVPNNIAYFSRCVQLPSAIYADSPTQKASLWYMMPSSLFKYSYDSDQNGKLTLFRTPFGTDSSAPITPEVVETYFDNLTANLFNDSDINLMGADIIKAFGIENCFKLPQITENYVTSYSFDPIMNLQIHNARPSYAMRSRINDASDQVYTVSQNMTRNCLVADGSFPSAYTGPDLAFYADQFRVEIPLDFPVDNPTNEMIVESTRLTAYNSGGTKIGACTEVIVSDHIYHFEWDTTDSTWSLAEFTDCIVLGTSHSSSGTGVTDNRFKDLMHKLSLASMINDYPIQYMITSFSGNGYGVPTSEDVFADFTNQTTISIEGLRAMNTACTLSIFSPNDLRVSRK